MTEVPNVAAFEVLPGPTYHQGQWTGQHYIYRNIDIVPDTVVYQLVYTGNPQEAKHDIGYNYVTKQWVDVGSASPDYVGQSLGLVIATHGSFYDPYYVAPTA